MIAPKTKAQVALASLGLLLVFAAPGEAQKIYRIGALVAEDQFLPAFEGFKKRMAELGYVEGNNIQYDLYNAKGNLDTLDRLAEKLVQDHLDLIVTSSTTATVPVAKRTSSVPIVFLSAGDPLRLVKSYASSGNNLTGISSASRDLMEKRVELSKEIVPGMKRLIFLQYAERDDYKAYPRLVKEAAKKLGLEVTEIEFRGRTPAVLRERLSLIRRDMGDSLLVPPEAPLVALVGDIVQKSIRERLPSVGPNVQTVRKGFLAGYSSEYYALGQQGAMLVDKILKGTRPTDLPIEQPSKLTLVINQKTARAIGLKVPREILLRADEVIQ